MSFAVQKMPRALVFQRLGEVYRPENCRALVFRMLYAVNGPDGTLVFRRLHVLYGPKNRR